MEKKFNIVFQTLKELRLDENILCQEFWRKILKLKENFNEGDCWDLIVENGEWLFNSGALKIETFKSWFPEDILNEHNIFTRGKFAIKDGKAIGMGNAKITSTGHSKILLWEKAHCDGFDSSFIKAFGHSTFTLKECVGEAFQNSRGVAGFQSKVEAWDNSRIEAQDYSFVVLHDNSEATLSGKAYSIRQ